VNWRTISWRRCRNKIWLAAAVALVVNLSGMPMSHAATPNTAWHEAQVDGHSLYYAVRGDGPTLVLLHGGGDSGEHSFEHQLDVFAEHHHIVSPDQVGQGRTPGVPGPLSYTHMMQDTAELLGQLKLKHVDLIGFSDGGIIALMLALRHPELVRRLVVSGVNVSPDGLNSDSREALRAVRADEHHPRTIDEKLAQLWLTSPTESELSLSLLKNIPQPVLVVSGDRDAITLEHTLQIYYALPQAELCILPGTDHGTFSARPEWLNPIITNFLNRAPDPGPTPLDGGLIQPSEPTAN
jgi:pimeloyl-ACP methyl ester carboxylesterase